MSRLSANWTVEKFTGISVPKKLKPNLSTLKNANKSNWETVIHNFSPAFACERRQYLDCTIRKTKWICSLHEAISWSTVEFKSKQRHKLQYGSITNDWKIIIPLVQKTVKYYNEYVSACGGPLYFNASMVPMHDHFPIEVGFCITIPKAQGRTIHKLIASIFWTPMSIS